MTPSKDIVIMSSKRRDLYLCFGNASCIILFHLMQKSLFEKYSMEEKKQKKAVPTLAQKVRKIIIIFIYFSSYFLSSKSFHNKPLALEERKMLFWSVNYLKDF